jgi:ankyrin repeat protein
MYACIHTHTHTHTEAGDTPLMKASWKGHVAIVTILLADRPSHGIDEMGTFLGTR